MTADEAERLMAGIVGWAQGEPACRALALVGSWARAEARRDSDLDLVALTIDPARWSTDAGWLLQQLTDLGFSADVPSLETYGVLRSWRVQAAPQVELELGFADLDWAQTSPIDPGTHRVVSDGLRILVDKDGRLANLLTAMA